MCSATLRESDSPLVRFSSLPFHQDLLLTFVELGSASLRVLFCKADGRVVFATWLDRRITLGRALPLDTSSGDGVREAAKTARWQGLGVRCLARQTDAASTRHALQPADHSLPLRVFARPPLPTVDVCNTNVSG